MQVHVTGSADLAVVRQRLRAVGNTGLGRQMSRGLSRAAKPLGPAVRAEVPRVMPSGYAPILSASLRFRIAQQSARRTARVTWRVHGDGKRERRDVPTLNKGVLRHPVYGRKRRLKSGAVINRPWVAQPIRPGFVDRPVDRLRPEVVRQMRQVIDDVAKQITKG